MKQSTLLIWIMLMCIAPMAQASNGNNFEFLFKENNISLYERWILNASGQSVRELQAVFYVQSDMNTIEQVLKSAYLGKKWNLNASDYAVRSQSKANEWVTYVRYDLPWPMDDQDGCLSYSSNRISNNAMEIKFQSTDHKDFPHVKGVQRITGIKGKWLVEKVGNEWKITYNISSNPSSSIPRYISDPFVRNNLIETLSEFRQLVKV